MLYTITYERYTLLKKNSILYIFLLISEKTHIYIFSFERLHSSEKLFKDVRRWYCNRFNLGELYKYVRRVIQICSFYFYKLYDLSRLQLFLCIF